MDRFGGLSPSGMVQMTQVIPIHVDLNWKANRRLINKTMSIISSLGETVVPLSLSSTSKQNRVREKTDFAAPDCKEQV